MKSIQSALKLSAVFIVVVLISAWILGCTVIDTDITDFEESASYLRVALPVYDDGGIYELLTEDGYYALGSAIIEDDIRVAFLDYDIYSRSYDPIIKPDDGYCLLRVYFRLTNLGSSLQSVGNINFSCVADGIPCQRYYVGTKFAFPSVVDLSSDEIAEGWVYFAVPESVRLLTVSYAGGDSPVFILNQH